MEDKLFKNSFSNLDVGNYNYAEKIKWPVDFGVKGSSDGIFGSMEPAINNIEALMYYNDALLLGNHTGPLGNKYKIDLGYCSEKSNDGKISLKKKIVDVDNIPSGNVNVSQVPKNAFGNQLRGIVPGLIESINDINPINFWNDLYGHTTCNENFVSNLVKEYKKEKKNIVLIPILLVLMVIFIYFLHL